MTNNIFYNQINGNSTFPINLNSDSFKSKNLYLTKLNVYLTKLKSQITTVRTNKNNNKTQTPTQLIPQQPAPTLHTQAL